MLSDLGDYAMSEFTREQHETMLDLARSTITSYVTSGQWQEYTPADSELLNNAGAFVTLRIDGQLRGCTGYLRPDKPVSHVIQEMAVSAASSDPRFPPLSEEELAHLTVGISILSTLTPVQRFEDIQIGVHGLLITHGGRRGVLLPQVPAERGWDRETFLTNLCYKAGLPGDAWKQGAQLFSFTAEVFGVD
jgi:AmmeMemoRadiSam system protein A